MIAPFRTSRHELIDLLDLKPEDIHIEDIAHSLANINRFNGHLCHPVSVAQHSYHVSHLCDPEFALQGLLHDASEAYIGDVTKWFKQTAAMHAYRALEERIQDLIYKKFGCPLEQHESVDYADRVMVRYEAMQGFYEDYKIDHPLYPELTKSEIILINQPLRWRFVDWQTAKGMFLERYRELAA